MGNGYLFIILAFVDLLNEMRFGKLSEQNKSRLIALSRQVAYRDSVEPTELYVPTVFWENTSMITGLQVPHEEGSFVRK